MSMTPIAKPDPLPHGWRFPRRALFLVIAGLAVLMFVVFAAIAAWPENPPPIEGPHWVTSVREDSITIGEPVRDTELRVWLVKFESGEILALYQKDPHLGCTVPWRGDFKFKGYTGWFHNPCHGETYDLTGYCYAGPCPRGLDRYETRVVDGWVQVRVGKGTLIQGPPVAYSGDGTWLREPVVPGHLSDPLVDAGLLSELQTGVPRHFEEGFFVVKLEQGRIRALSDVDVHAVQVRWPTSCFTIEWRDYMHFDGRDGWFRGPCSGSTFDLDGTRMFGPTANDMQNYDVSVGDTGEIVVNTARICKQVGTIGCSD